MDSKSIPFGMRKIELSCGGVIKEYPPEHMEERHPYDRSSDRRSFKGHPSATPGLEEKKNKWKDLINDKQAILKRMTDYVKLYLEIKMTKTDDEDKRKI